MSNRRHFWGTHKGCGGEIVEDLSVMYEYEGSKIPAYRCSKCGEEILGDADFEDDPNDWHSP